MTDLELLKAYCEGGLNYFDSQCTIEELSDFDRGYKSALKTILCHLEFCIDLKKEKGEKQ